MLGSWRSPSDEGEMGCASSQPQADKSYGEAEVKPPQSPARVASGGGVNRSVQPVGSSAGCLRGGLPGAGGSFEMRASCGAARRAAVRRRSAGGEGHQPDVLALCAAGRAAAGSRAWGSRRGTWHPSSP